MSKALQLREIRLYVSKLAEKHGAVPADLSFLRTTHHVAQIFSLLLPRGYILDGSSLVQFNFGSRGTEPDCFQALGVTSIYVDPFDFSSYRLASSHEREKILIDCVESNLSQIAQRVGADTRPICETADATRKCRFSLEVEVPKLRKSIPGRQGSVKVFRQLASSVSEAWIAKVVGRDGSIKSQHQMQEPAPLNRSDFFRKAEVLGDSYVVRDRFDDEVFRLPFVDA